MSDTSSHIASLVSFDHEGESYTLTPLAISDLRELEKYLQRKVMDQLREDVTGMPELVQRELTAEAIGRRAKIKIGTDEFASESQSLDGVTFMLWISLRKRHANISLATTAKMVEDGGQEVLSKLNEAAGFTSDHPTVAT